MKQPNPTARQSDATGASSSNAPSISRRAFVGATAALGAASLGGAADLVRTYGEAQAAEAAEERTFECVCRPNCHGFCRHKVTVRDGLVVKSERASFPDSRYDRICLRGITSLQRIYDPDRIKYPMRRAGRARRGQMGAHHLGRGHRHYRNEVEGTSSPAMVRRRLLSTIRAAMCRC